MDAVEQMAYALRVLRDAAGPWMSAAQSDPNVCTDMKHDYSMTLDIAFLALKSFDAEVEAGYVWVHESNVDHREGRVMSKRKDWREKRAEAYRSAKYLTMQFGLPEGYVVLNWPEGISLESVNHMQTMINFQIDEGIRKGLKP